MSFGSGNNTVNTSNIEENTLTQSSLSQQPFSLKKQSFVSITSHSLDVPTTSLNPVNNNKNADENFLNKNNNNNLASDYKTKNEKSLINGLFDRTRAEYDAAINKMSSGGVEHVLIVDDHGVGKHYDLDDIETKLPQEKSSLKSSLKVEVKVNCFL